MSKGRRRTQQSETCAEIRDRVIAQMLEEQAARPDEAA